MFCLDHKASSKAFKGLRLQRVTSGLTPGLQCYFAGTTNPHRYSGCLCTHSRQAYSFRSIILEANFVIYFFPFGRKQFFSFLSFNIVKYSYKSALLSVKYLLMPLNSDIHVSLRVHYNSRWFLKLLSVTLINLIFNLSKRPKIKTCRLIFNSTSSWFSLQQTGGHKDQTTNLPIRWWPVLPPELHAQLRFACTVLMTLLSSG